MASAWQIRKWNQQRGTNPYQQMKDKDMTGVEVVFKKSNLPNHEYYYFEEIHQPGKKITMTYIANLGGRKGVNRYWTWHGYGGWIPYITFDAKEFTRMKNEVERLGGSVIIKEVKENG